MLELAFTKQYHPVLQYQQLDACFRSRALRTLTYPVFFFGKSEDPEIMSDWQFGEFVWFMCLSLNNYLFIWYMYIHRFQFENFVVRFTKNGKNDTFKLTMTFFKIQTNIIKRKIAF